MARILCTWELGGDLGHIKGFVPLALELRRRGHEVAFALKDLSRAETVLGPHGFRALQAPVLTAVPKEQARTPLSYAEILPIAGFANGATLTALVKAWRHLFELLRTDFVLADHSPAALLAARSAGIRRAPHGDSFSIPPRMAPFPVMRPGTQAPAGRLERAEAAALEAANAALAAVGAPPLAALQDLLEADETFIRSFGELDHYGGSRPGARYWGGRFSTGDGVPASWPPQAERRVFAYLKPRARDFGAVMEVLGALRAASLVYAPGLSAADAARYSRGQVKILAQPARLDGLLKNCTLGLCHGSNTATALLISGVPLVIVPMQLEQHLLGRRIEALGAGRLAQPGTDAAGYRKLFAELIRNPSCREGARRFAEKYRDYDPQRQSAAIADRIEQILG